MSKLIDENTQSVSKRVLELTFYNAERYEAADIPEFLAYEILDLTEIMCEDCSMVSRVLGEVLKHDDVSEKTKRLVLGIHPLRRS